MNMGSSMIVVNVVSYERRFLLLLSTVSFSPFIFCLCPLHLYNPFGVALKLYFFFLLAFLVVSISYLPALSGVAHPFPFRVLSLVLIHFNQSK